MKVNKLMLAAFIAMLFLSACEPKEQKLYIVSTNDMHANIDNFPKLAFVIDSLRTAHPGLLVFSAGDNRSGNPINDRYAEPAKPMYDLMNAVGFDLSTLGNHEWDNGPLSLRDALGWAQFPFVCANVTFDDSLQMPNIYPYKVFERDGLKIGVIGGIQVGQNGLPDFHPKNANGSHFVPLADVLQKYIDELKDCNAVFLLTHCGYEEDRETAAQFPCIDAIFGGHSHTLVGEKQLVGNVMITQAESRVNYVTLSTFTFRDGKLVDKDMQMISIKKASQRDEKTQSMVDSFNSNDFFKTVVTTNVTPIERNEALGCLMTDAIRETLGADLSFQNPGGVRYDTLSARPITLKDILALDPFDNEIIRYTLTGEEIIRLMEVSPIVDKGPIYCSGCTYTYKKVDDHHVSDIKVTLDNGKPLDLEAKYDVVMNSYMSSVFDFEHEDDGATTFRTSNELMMEFLQNHPEIDYGKAKRLFEQ